MLSSGGYDLRKDSYHSFSVKWFRLCGAVVASEIRELSDSTKKLIVENNAKAEEIIPKINASIDSIKDLIENINEMNEKVATIAATSEEISSQTSCVQSMADELRDAVENI